MKYIYKISSSNSNNVYVGKCGNSLSVRFAQHKYYYNNYIKEVGTPFYSSTWVFIDGDAQIEELELCEDHKSSERESFYMTKLKNDGFNVVNIRDGVVNKEKARQRWIKYYYQNRDKKIQLAKNYYWKNLEKCKEYQKNRYHTQVKKKKPVPPESPVDPLNYILGC